MFTILVLVLFAINILLYAVYKLKRRHLEKLVEHIPGPPGYPIVGNLFMYSRCNNEEILKRYFEVMNNYGDGLFKLWIGPQLVVSTAEPDIVEVVMGNHKFEDKSELMTQALKNRTEGVFVYTGDIWKKQRHLVNKLFTPNHIELYLKHFSETSRKLVKRLSKFSPEDIVNVGDWVLRCTTENACISLLGVNVDLQNNANLTYTYDLCEGSHIMFNIPHDPFKLASFIYRFSEEGKTLKKVNDRVYDFCLDIINQRKIWRSLPEEEREKHTNIEDRPTYLDTMLELLENDKDYTERRLVREALDVLIAGSDTVAVTESFALLMMGMFPAWQKKLQDEIDEILGDDDRDLSMADINKLVNTELVMKEVYRLFPTPALGRLIKEDTKVGNHVIPAGAVFYIPVLYLHRHHKYWTKPNDFIPERFLPENSSNIPKCLYIPFSHGVRKCPGTKYSLLYNKVMLAHVMRNFTVSSDMKYEELKLTSGLLVEPVGGFKLRFTRRR